MTDAGARQEPHRDRGCDNIDDTGGFRDWRDHSTSATAAPAIESSRISLVPRNIAPPVAAPTKASSGVFTALRARPQIA